MSLSLKKETELGPHLVSWLIDLGWEVYQEVGLGTGMGIVDVVAQHGPILWAIEMKLTVNMTLLDQAYNRKSYFHRTSIFVPNSGMRRGFKARRLGELFCRQNGIGVIYLDMKSQVDGYTPLREDVAPRMNRRPLKNYITLCEYQKTYAKAGNAEGRRWTPFKQTCEAVREFVKGHEGATLKEMVDGIEHHYASPASARSTLPKWIDDGKVPGVRIEREGRRIRLYSEA